MFFLWFFNVFCNITFLNQDGHLEAFLGPLGRKNGPGSSWSRIFRALKYQVHSSAGHRATSLGGVPPQKKLLAKAKSDNNNELLSELVRFVTSV